MDKNLFAVRVGNDIYEVKATERGVNLRNAYDNNVFLPTKNILSFILAIFRAFLRIKTGRVKCTF